MIAYVDTSALLRAVLREPGALQDLQAYDGLVSSEMIAVESASALLLKWYWPFATAAVFSSSAFANGVVVKPTV